jgi:hypothetical protein
MGGNHKVRVPLGPTLPDWLPLEVLHFPIRTTSQLARKFTKIPVDGLVRPGRHWVQMAGDLEEKGFDAVLEARLVVDDALERGLADGSLTRDTRVRDVLRRAHGAGSGEPSQALFDDDLALAREFGDLHPVASTARLRHRLGGLEQRVAAMKGARSGP